MANSIPRFAQRYFWDVDAKKLDADKHATYVIERLLEWGNPQAARWLVQRYSRRKIISVLKKTRALSRMSANFWAVYFGLPKNEIRHFVELCYERPKGTWPYWANVTTVSELHNEMVEGWRRGEVWQ
ncbi:MAG: hypothetical protein A2Z03_03205 [Chloroflexi bacterium RBG_16_56_8]|nr:MAG: hypothetical protein A2Z03_03205 [Chloroflexi bacterium RBG_16_56_8]